MMMICFFLSLEWIISEMEAILGLSILIETSCSNFLIFDFEMIVAVSSEEAVLVTISAKTVELLAATVQSCQQ